jgi:phospholipase A2
MRRAGVLHLRWTAPPAAVFAAWSSWGYWGPGRLHTDGPTQLWDQRSEFSTSSLHSAQTKRRDIPPEPSTTNATGTDPNGVSQGRARKDRQVTAWATFTQKFGVVKDSFGSIEWSGIGGTIKNYIVPDWARYLPATMQKLQRELSMAPGSLADDIWREAHDVDINPEIAWDAKVRVGQDLCRDELAFRRKRQVYAAKALAKYLDLKEEDIHPDDVPTIAMCGSGGGLRALVAGTGYYSAAQQAGLWDCVTYTSGVSGSCWLQTLYNSSLSGRDFNQLVQHLKSRLGVHIAFPPKALNLLTTAPTNKYLLSGMVEKLKGDPDSDFGLVDIYGLLLAARLLVPKGELGLSDRDLKLSNQRDYMDDGSNPLPIYAAVRHEIPLEVEETKGKRSAEKLKEAARREAWFQWFEFTPYEFFCEELNAGIPMWAVGRHFDKGKNVVPSNKYAVPELRIPALMGIWGSAFCATLSHYYKEIRPVVKGLAGFAGIDSLIEGRNKDLIRVHPIDPASIPNYVVGMKDQLPASCPESIFSSNHLRLMDAGMSNNLPIYPLLRPGRNVDIVVAFDASADIKQENWLSIVDGYARQRGLKGWPIGAGWPKASDSEPEDTLKTLRENQKLDENATEDKLTTVQAKDAVSHKARMIDTLMTSDSGQDLSLEVQPPHHDLTFCNVWLGTKEEKMSDEEPPPSKRLFHPSHGDDHESDFHLMKPDAGIAVVYFPLLPNPNAPDLTPSKSPATKSSSTVSDPEKPLAPKPSSIKPDVDDFLSTWNFVYTPEQVDSVVGLAKANFAEGEAQVKRVVRGVYERKKRDRLQRERAALEAKLKQLEEERRRMQEEFVSL